MMLESVSPSLRGELTRWLIEPKAGVFVGNLSAMVRQKLWEKVTARVGGGGAILIHSAQNEQNFSIVVAGNPTRTITDWDGLQLVTRTKTL